MSGRLAGKVAVITGGASGIGWQTAQLFVAEGAKVVIGDNNAALLGQRGSTIGGDGCVTAEVDVTQESDLERLVSLAAETFGGVDVAVNCAGMGFLGSVHEHSVDSWRAVLDVCLTGTFLAVKHEARAMLDQGTGGAIVNISSISGRQVSEGMAAYCSAKAGVDMLTRVAAVELGPRGLRVNAIAPGFVETPMTAPTRAKIRQAFLDAIPLGRAGQPADIARAALFLVGEEAAWVNGETFVVDGGGVQREAPRFLSGYG
jgi:NAD(P)-dependent dehydrogenase (short-subunit alcohol dehydrogenase family)